MTGDFFCDLQKESVFAEQSVCMVTLSPEMYCISGDSILLYFVLQTASSA